MSWDKDNSIDVPNDGGKPAVKKGGKRKPRAQLWLNDEEWAQVSAVINQLGKSGTGYVREAVLEVTIRKAQALKQGL